MAAITAAIVKRTGGDSGKLIVVDLTFHTTYTTGGDALPANAALGIEQSLDAIILAGSLPATATTAYALVVDLANRKIKAFTSNGAAPAALLEYTSGGAALNNLVVRALIYGDAPNA
jgi:hypothetical protein